MSLIKILISWWNKVNSFFYKKAEFTFSDKAIFNKKESKIVKSLSALSKINVSDIMVTRKEIFAFPINISKEEILSAMQDHHYTRVPVYKNNLDNIIGFIHIKDILCNIDNDFQIKDIMRNIIFVPTPMKALELLMKMQCSHIHVAIVLDEYGGTEGLVTIVNIIEEIVGNMDDEHDKHTEPALIKIADGKFEVDGLMEVTTLGAALNVKFDNEDYDTVSGLINTLVGRIPEKGEIITDGKITYEITEADDRCIHKVIISLEDAA